jgi:tRNA pseudouridine38-40 synthase
MRNIKLTIQYDGTEYNGWQVQPNQKTIQGSLEQAIEKISTISTKIIGSGRTDARVHALGQVANFKTDSSIPITKFARAINSVLPSDIRVIEAVEVEDSFHARYSARGKVYRYCLNLGQQINVFQRNYTYHYPYSLDLDLLAEGAKLLEGTHDFRGLAAADSSVKDYIRTIEKISLFKKKENLFIEFKGNGFLYNMVRIAVGTLLDLGRGKLKPTVINQILATGDRSLAGPTVPGHGLFLVKVFYDH